MLVISYTRRDLSLIIYVERNIVLVYTLRINVSCRKMVTSFIKLTPTLLSLATKKIVATIFSCMLLKWLIQE